MNDRSACVGCQPHLIPAGRVGEHHVGVRFGDHSGSGVTWSVTLNGFDVVMQCVEALAGEAGWVVLYALDDDGKRFVCPGTTHMQQHRYDGEVSHARTPVPAE